MRPDTDAALLLSTTRAKAKMYEFRVPDEEHIRLPRHPSLLHSLGVGLLGDAAAELADSAVPMARFERGASGERWDSGDASMRDASLAELRFAATFFDAYLDSQLDIDLTIEFSLLCAAAYYLSDNPGSARVVVSRSEAPAPDWEGGLPWLVHAILTDTFDLADEFTAYADLADPLLRALGAFFAVEDGDDPLAICQSIRERAYLSGSPRELLYADITTAICLRRLENSARNILPDASGLTLAQWSDALKKSHFPRELWPAQRKICQAGLLSGASAVIQMPTSAGKTRATELIIRSAFLASRTDLAVMVAPFRSLCHDIRSDLTKAFAGEDIAINEATDSYQSDVGDILLMQKTVLIVTPEKLLYLLRRQPELGAKIGLIVYDEGHQFEGMARGPNYELLLTSLKIDLKPGTQVVLISAVIGNAGDVAAWLLGDAAAVVSGEGLLPTTKSIAFASWKDQRGRLEYVAPTDPDEREFFVPRVIEAVQLALRARERKPRIFPERTGPDVGLYLGLQIVGNGSVAVFCGRKDTAAGLCRRAVEIFGRDAPFARPVDVSNADEVARIAQLCAEHLGTNADAAQAAKLGIFAHHSNVPQGLRLSIEHAMKEGLTRFVICTSTLAQGVNFPIRYLVVTGTQQGQERIKIRDFHNLIGRAGRAGMHTEGSVIFSAPDVYDQRSVVNESWRWRGAKELLDPANAEPCKSSILSIFEPYQQTYPAVVLALSRDWLPELAFADAAAIDNVVQQGLQREPLTIASEFRAFLDGRARAIQSVAAFLLAHGSLEEDGALERVAALAANTLAYHLADDETKGALVAAFQGIATKLIENADVDLRSLMRRSPLPPLAVADLKRWLDEQADAVADAVEAGDLLDALHEKLLAHVTAGSVKKLTDQTVILPALRAWINGDSFETIRTIFTQRNVRISNRYVTVEDVVALCEGGFAYDMAMVSATVADLLEDSDEETFESATLLQKRIKYGLTNPAAIALMEAGFADRVVATQLAAAYGDAQDRYGARAILRRSPEAARAILLNYPSYFTAVLDELISG